jgi:hypothetical protein
MTPTFSSRLRSLAQVSLPLVLASAPVWTARSAGAADVGTLYGVKDTSAALIVRTLDLATLKVTERGTLPRVAAERLADVYQNANRSTTVLQTATSKAVTSHSAARPAGSPENVAGGVPGRASGLRSLEAISSLVAAPSGTSLGLVGHYTDTPPFSVATMTVSPAAITVTKTVPLDPVTRYANLTQCPDGTYYATAMGPQFDTRLAQIESQGAKVTLLAELTFHGDGLANDVWDLACGPSGQLYAVADPEYKRTNSLFAVDAKTGVLTFVTEYDVTRMVFVK